MKKHIIALSGLLFFICFYTCNNNDAQKNEETVLENQDLASNTELPVIIKKHINSDFIFDVAPRFNPIKKSELNKVKSFRDFIAEEHADRIVKYYSLNVILLDGTEKTDIRENGKGGDFNDAQIKLLQSADYATNLLIWSDYRERSFEDGELQNSTWTPYISVVPEKQAEFLDGKKSLISYLDDKSKSARINIDNDKLKPANISFIVTENGTIKSAKTDNSSGYPNVDDKLLELISNTAGSWIPAENSNGEKVDQMLTISFGVLGC
jgi:TonB family protein